MTGIEVQRLQLIAGSTIINFNKCSKGLFASTTKHCKFWVRKLLIMLQQLKKGSSFLDVQSYCKYYRFSHQLFFINGK